MSRQLCFAFISFLLLFIPQDHAAKNVRDSISLSTFTARLEKSIPKLMQIYHIPGVNIALVKKGEVVWSGAWGKADLASGRKMTTDTYCRVESISKSVTAWGVMKLVDQGKIELDAPVENYFQNWSFPESEFSEEKVTVRQLLSQSAGMPLGTIGVRYEPSALLPSLKTCLTREAIIQQEPGKSFYYSNVGYHLLELLIEEVSGRNFTTYMQEEILQPLGMQRATFTWSANMKPPVPYGYDMHGNLIPVYVYPQKAAGGLFADLEDIARFVTAGMTKFSSKGLTVLSTGAIQEIYTPQIEVLGAYGLVFESYGFGHFLEELPSGQVAISHGGQGSGWMTHFHAVPETGDGIVILTNSQRSWPFFTHVLKQWADWNGFESLGMERILQGTMIIWGIVVLIFLFSGWQLWQLFRGIITNKHSFDPLTRIKREKRIVQFFFSVLLFSTLLWSVSQDYLMINAVFPVAFVWLRLSILSTSIVLLALVLFPEKPESL